MDQSKSVQYVPQSPQSSPSDGSSFDKVSPSILIITIMLAIIFFISGLLHLLIRFLVRPSNRESNDLNNVAASALQGRLQQLFHLHDAGVDQSLIDNLPVFSYKSIIGLNDPFDCAVCLCEFEDEDALRLLPNCSHAFHVECIDTWLLAHSTCPLCRASLLLDSSAVNVHESGIIESSTEIVTDGVSVVRSNSNLGLCEDDESCEIMEKDEVFVDSGEKVVSVKLGKLRNVDGIESCSDDNKIDSRRCFSMGSFEYVMDENSSLQVLITRTSSKKPSRKKKNRPGQRTALSECDCESRRGFNCFEATSTLENDIEAIEKKKSKKESLSISKIWLRGKKEKQSIGVGSSRRAFSFRFPMRQDSLSGSCSAVDDDGGKGVGCDEENQRCHGLDTEAKTTSFGRRSLVWLAGRQNKVIHSSSSSNV